jgi:hypothetical protein
MAVEPKPAPAAEAPKSAPVEDTRKPIIIQLDRAQRRALALAAIDADCRPSELATQVLTSFLSK